MSSPDASKEFGLGQGLFAHDMALQLGTEMGELSPEEAATKSISIAFSLEKQRDSAENLSGIDPQTAASALANELKIRRGLSGETS